MTDKQGDTDIERAKEFGKRHMLAMTATAALIGGGGSLAINRALPPDHELAVRQIIAAEITREMNAPLNRIYQLEKSLFQTRQQILERLASIEAEDRNLLRRVDRLEPDNWYKGQ